MFYFMKIYICVIIGAISTRMNTRVVHGFSHSSITATDHFEHFMIQANHYYYFFLNSVCSGCSNFSRDYAFVYK